MPKIIPINALLELFKKMNEIKFNVLRFCVFSRIAFRIGSIKLRKEELKKPNNIEMRNIPIII